MTTLRQSLAYTHPCATLATLSIAFRRRRRILENVVRLKFPYAP